MHVEDVIFGRFGGWKLRPVSSKHDDDSRNDGCRAKRTCYPPPSPEGNRGDRIIFPNVPIVERSRVGGDEGENGGNEDVFAKRFRFLRGGERLYEIKEETRVTRECRFRVRYKSLWIQRTPVFAFAEKSLTIANHYSKLQSNIF